MSDKENKFSREVASRRGRVPEIDSVTKLYEIVPQFRVIHDDLYHAIQDSRLDIVKRLIEEFNVDVNGHDHSGSTYLSVAVDVGNEKIVGYLLSVSNIRVDAADQDGTTPLWRALNKFGTLTTSSIVESLIQKADINLRSVDGDHALLWAIKSRSRQPRLIFGNPPKSVLSLLLNRKDLDVNQFDREGRGALSLAVDLGYLSILNELLARDDVRVNICGQNCRTPLSLAVENCRDPAIVRALLSHPDINAYSVDNQGRTPLIWSIISHNLGVVELLLEKESRLLNIPDSRGRTPLSWAAGSGTWEITKKLLQREGVDKDSRDHCGRTALSWAVENKSQPKKISNKFGNSLSHDHILGLLLAEEGINNNSKDEEGRTPLSWAATEADLLIVKYLVGPGCVSVDEPDIIGRTPLSWSAQYGRSEVVNLLLSAAGADPNLEDDHGRTPLYWATREYSATGENYLKVMQMLIREDIDTLKKMVKEDPEQPERVKLLLDAGYDACKLDTYGKTPLHHAVAAENVESTKLLISSGPESINSRDNYGITPLKVAVGTSHVLAKILIENGATTNEIQPKEWFQVEESSAKEIACLSDQGAVHGLQYMTRENLMDEVSKPLPADHKGRRLILCKHSPPPWEHGSVLGFKKLPAGVDLRIDVKSNNENGVPGELYILLETSFPDTFMPWYLKQAGDQDSGDASISCIVKQDPRLEFVSADFLSTLPYSKIPTDGAEFFVQFMNTLERRWSRVLDGMEKDIRKKIRFDRGIFDPRNNHQLEKVIPSDEFINQLESCNRNLYCLRDTFEDHVTKGSRFIDKSCLTHNEGRGMQLAMDTIAHMKVQVNPRLDRLEQILRDTLQFEFTRVSMAEARRSTVIATSMRRLTWMTFVFLPLMFTSSLFGMNVDVLEDNPDWRWCILVMAATVFLTLGGWLAFERIPV